MTRKFKRSKPQPGRSGDDAKRLLPPQERAKVGSMLASIAREAGGLTEDEAARFVELRGQQNVDAKEAPPSLVSPRDAPAAALPSQRFVPREEVAAAARVAPRVDVPQFRADVDAILDQNPDPRDPPEPRRG